MSRDELVTAYIEGGVSRRTFIRRLVGAGVSLGAAVSYAHLLAPTRAGAQTGPQFYPDFYRPPQLGVELVPKPLSDVANDGFLETFVSVQEPALIQLSAVATVSGGSGGAASESKRRRRRRRQATVASAAVDFPSAARRLIQLPLTPDGLKLIRRARKLSLTVTAVATDRQGQVSTLSAQQSLKRKKRKKRK